MSEPGLVLPSRGKVLRAMLVVVLPIIVWAVWFAGNYRGLVTSEGLHFAQLSRNIAEGGGWVTSVVTPLGLHDFPRIEQHPELWRAPLYALGQACLFFLAGPHGTVAAVASGLPWMLLLWYTYRFVRRIANVAVSLLVFLLVLMNPVLLDLSIAGTPHTLAALLLVCFFGQFHAAALTREARRAAAPDAPDRIPVRSIAGTALLAAAIALTDHDLALPVMLLGMFLWLMVSPWVVVASIVRHRGSTTTRLLKTWTWLTRHPLPRVAGLFLAVFVAATSAWWGRSARLTGDPFYTLHHYSLMTNTRTHPGQSIYRQFSTATTLPEAFALTHPHEMLVKISAGLNEGLTTLIKDTNPFVFAVFCAVLLMPARRNTVRLLMRAVATLALAHLLAVAAHEQDRNDLAVLIPLILVFGVAELFGWLNALYEKESRSFSTTQRKAEPLLPPAPIVATLLVLILFSVTAVVGSRLAATPKARLAVSPNIEFLSGRLEAGTAVLSACPWIPAWQGRVSSIWMPGDHDSMNTLKNSFGRQAGWLYFTRQRALAATPDEPPAVWFEWIRTRLGAAKPVKNLSAIPREYVFAPGGD